MQICCMFPVIAGKGLAYMLAANEEFHIQVWDLEPTKLKTRQQKHGTHVNKVSIPNVPSKNFLYPESRPFLIVPQMWNRCQNHR